MTTTSAPQQVFGHAFGGNPAEHYERYFVPAIAAPLATTLVAAANLRSGERVLDVACGTGIVARLSADHVGAAGRVAGADVNAGMLAVARAVTASTATPIQWYETGAEAMPLPDEAFDVVLCQFGLQFVAHKHAALAEMQRVLVMNGRAHLSVPTPTPFFDILEQALANHGLPAAAAFVRLVFSMHDAAQLERLLRGAGFSAVDVQSQTTRLRLPPPTQFFWQYIQSTPAAAAIAQVDDKARSSLEREVVAKWQPWLAGDGLAPAQEIMVATARK